MGYVFNTDNNEDECVSDDTQRWNDTVKRLYKEIEDADNSYQALYNDHASVKADYAELTGMYQTALETIMRQARELRATQEALTIASGIITRQLKGQ